jgi:hypothetical protein
MELALWISRASQIDQLDDATGGRRIRGFDPRFLAFLRNTPVRRLYFGSESCQNAMPTRNELDLLQECAEQRQLEFTLVTPVCTDVGLAHLGRLLCSRTRPVCEVVVNDLGVLHFIRENSSACIVAGRLLARSKKWPDGDIPADSLEIIRHAPFGLKEYVGLLSRYGVQRVEIDNRKEGYNETLDELPFEKTLHLPFVFLSAGRICLLAGKGRRANERFGLPRTCPQYCREVTVRINGEFYSDGCGVYAINDDLANLSRHRFSRVAISLGV